MRRTGISGKHAQSHANTGCNSVDNKIAQTRVTARSEDLRELYSAGKKHKGGGKSGPIAGVTGAEGNSGGAENGKMLKMVRRARLGS
jgi:hypothetical protein